jgi:hypothetical protein
VSIQPAGLSEDTRDLIQRFHEDCRLRGIVSTMDYIYRAKEFCAFVNAGQEMHKYSGMKVLRSINTYLVQVSLSPSLSSCVELSLDVFVP